MLLSLWGGVSLAAMRRWWHERAVGHQDDQLRALLAGRVVPLPRQAPDNVLPQADRNAV
ncbi:MAG: hypothetical protein JWP11_581 [Frankiales bacterium]|nr:hypothetical protein [Frankiales bacterium]